MTKVSLHRFANLPRRFLRALCLGIGILTVGAIAPPPSPTEDTVAPLPRLVPDQFATLPSTLEATERVWHAAVADRPEVMTVTLFTPTASCEGYEGVDTAIAQDKAVPQIVHLLIANQVPKLINFELAGYRVQSGPKGNTVTIDFRRSPDALRHFVSLSICERRILFGSLRQTLLENPALGIDDIQFTERGRPIEI